MDMEGVTDNLLHRVATADEVNTQCQEAEQVRALLEAILLLQVVPAAAEFLAAAVAAAEAVAAEVAVPVAVEVIVAAAAVAVDKISMIETLIIQCLYRKILKHKYNQKQL